MKYLLLFIVSFYGSKGFSQLDTIQCSDQFPSYINDAKYLALRVIDSANSSYVDSVIIPASYYIPILRDLNAIEQYGSFRVNSQYPYFNTIDSIFGILDVHARAEAQASIIAVTTNGSTGWVENIFNDSIYSGNDTIDNLAYQYGLYYSSPYVVYDMYNFSVNATYPINMTPIVNTISTMAETYATYGELIGDASDIYLVDSGYVRHYTFRYGGGDCPSGCDINYYWKFSVYSDCIVQFDTSYYSDYTRIGVQNINAGKLNVYPNPASEKVTVEFADNKHNGTLLKLYGISGSLIQQINISSPKVELDISGIAPGIYDIELASSDLTIHRKLVVY